ncbi:MAG: hypothetical protein P1Q69_05625 [Candidatus Thorarchaeota archaeon]|nr:hypothetical protein [Candidatus Thorarchaeota archaeon]
MKDDSDSVEDTKHPIQDDDNPDHSWFQAVRIVTSNRNWTVLLATVWIYSSMVVMYQYFTLYFRDIGISYIVTGAIFSMMYAINVIGNLVSS